MVTVWLSDQIWMAEIKREGDTTDNPNFKYHTKKKGKKRKEKKQSKFKPKIRTRKPTHNTDEHFRFEF